MATHSIQRADSDRARSHRRPAAVPRASSQQPRAHRGLLLTAALAISACTWLLAGRSTLQAQATDRAAGAPLAGSQATAPIAPVAGIAATPPVPAVTLLQPGVPVPANGSFIIQSGGRQLSAASISLLDPSGKTIDGTIRMIGIYSVWTPSRMLVAGTQYTLSIMSPSTVVSATNIPVMVGPAWTPARVAVTSMLALDVMQTPGTTRCCTSVPGVSKGATGCFVSDERSNVRMMVGLMSTASAAELGQFLFRLSPADPTLAFGSYTTLSSLANTAVTWNTAATQYCVNLEAIEITSGRSYDYNDLMPRCLNHGNLGDIGVKSIDIDAPKVLAHEICPVPPPTYETNWCDVNRAGCGADRSLIGCENYGHLCLGEATPLPPAAGSGAPPSAGTASTLAGSGAGGSKAAAGTSGGAGRVAVVVSVAGAASVPAPPVAGASVAAAGSGVTQAGAISVEPTSTATKSSGCSVSNARGSQPSTVLGCMFLGMFGNWLRRRKLR